VIAIFLFPDALAGIGFLAIASALIAASALYLLHITEPLRPGGPDVGLDIIQPPPLHITVTYRDARPAANAGKWTR
jgi:hypothetical protein